MNTATDVIIESARTRLLARVPVLERTVTTGGVETAVLEGGEGPPIVLLHGPGESAAVWLPVLGDLVGTHRVIAADLPGHGASAAPAYVLHRDWIDSWLDELISATCATPPVLVVDLGSLRRRHVGRGRRGSGGALRLAVARDRRSR